MRPVPVDIVTGFLGAGKTTLLAHVLGGALGIERVAVIVNEVGDVSIDGRVIGGLEHVESMVELEGGCVCCTIDDARFELAVEEIVRTADPTLIVLETTGVADPRPVLARSVRAGLSVDALITVVDAANFERASRETSIVRSQVVEADFLVINKCDLVSADDLQRLRRRLGRVNPRALLLDCERGRVPSDLLFATGIRRLRGGAAAAGAESSSGLEGIEAVTWQGSGVADYERFQQFLRKLPPSIYRAKGLVRFDTAGWSCLFHVTCGRSELNWVQLSADSAPPQAVFVGREASRWRADVLRELDACHERARRRNGEPFA